MNFSAVLRTLQGEGAQWRAEVPASWGQGRTVFGGLQAALAFTAMRRRIPPGWPLRTLQTSFIAPLPPGAVRIEVRVLRTGSSAIHVEARLLDGEATACLLLGIFGLPRESLIAVDLPVPEFAALKNTRTLPYIDGVTPAFTRHVDFHWARGGFPFSGSGEAKMQVYVRLRDPAPVGEAQMVALADSIPSPGLSLLPRPAAASSLSWTLEMLGAEHDGDPQGHWLMDAEVSVARNGYLSQTATLWTPSGRPAALSRQTVVVFA